MKIRVVYELINQVVICGDWQEGTIDSAERTLAEYNISPGHLNISYCNILRNGVMRAITASNVANMFIQQEG